MKYWASVATIIAAGTGIVALIQTQALSTADEQNAALSSRNSALASENADLREQLASANGANDQLREINSEQRFRIFELERQVQPIPDDAAAPEIRKAQTLTLAANGLAIDLNSIDENFGASAEGRFNADHASIDREFYSTGELRFVVEGADIARVPEAPARFASCVIAANYTEAKPIPLTELQDERTCIRLESGRIATVSVDSFTTNEATLRVTVWQLP